MIPQGVSGVNFFYRFIIESMKAFDLLFMEIAVGPKQDEIFVDSSCLVVQLTY